MRETPIMTPQEFRQTLNRAGVTEAEFTSSECAEALTVVLSLAGDPRDLRTIRARCVDWFRDGPSNLLQVLAFEWDRFGAYEKRKLPRGWHITPEMTGAEFRLALNRSGTIDASWSQVDCVSELTRALIAAGDPRTFTSLRSRCVKWFRDKPPPLMQVIALEWERYGAIAMQRRPKLDTQYQTRSP